MRDSRLIEEKVDIHECPEAGNIIPANLGDELTFGDLHGNAIKLLFLLVKHGIAQNITKSTYAQLVKIYQKSFETEGLSADDLIEFDALLNSIEFKSQATIRLLGDILADRGGNDYLTLLILHKLYACGVKYEIILSNHDLEFLINLLKMGYRSMTALCRLICNEEIDRDGIDSIMMKAYLPFLKLLSYTADEQKIVLFSHATDEMELFPVHIINLDNNLGKALYSLRSGLEYYNQGIYTLLHSRQIDSPLKITVSDKSSALFSALPEADDSKAKYDDSSTTPSTSQKTSKD